MVSLAVRSAAAPSCSSGSGSEPPSPDASPVMSAASSHAAPARPKRRRVALADLPGSPSAAKRRLLVADMLFGGLERTAPSLVAVFILLVLLFQLLRTSLHAPLHVAGAPPAAAAAAAAAGAPPGPAARRMTNARVVDELRRWTDPDYARSRIRVYYYDLPPRFNTLLVQESHRNPPKIRDPYCDESFYSAENTLANYFKTAPVRTLNASDADFFYVPILTTCYLMTNLPNDLNKTGSFFAAAMDLVIREYPFWNRTDGRDHVFMFAQGFGARLAGHWRKYRHATFLVHNGDYDEDHYDTHKDIVVPPDLSHYFTPVALTHPARLLQKKNFVLFGGQVLNASIADHRGSNYSGGVRQYIQSHLSAVDGYKVTGVRSHTYIQDIMDSVFCLAPHGWHKWSPRPAYAVLLGCIPVVITEKQQLFLQHLIDYSAISFWVRPSDVRHLDAKLRALRRDELTRRELAMRDVWPLFWYGNDGLAEEAILYSLYRKLATSKPHRPYI